MAAVHAGNCSASGAVRSRRRHCFDLVERSPEQPCSVELGGASAEALAALLPLLGCGEEAAIAGFDRLSRAGGLEAASRTALHGIALDERRHEAMLRGLEAALPRRPDDPAMRRAARRFHLGLSGSGATVHLARIAGIDAAVCTILTRLLRSESAVARDPGVVPVIAHIRRDEARHVATSRAIAMAAIGYARAREAAAEAREGLADLLVTGAPAFERLGVDPDRLDKAIRTLPNGLFPR